MKTLHICVCQEFEVEFSVENYSKLKQTDIHASCFVIDPLPKHLTSSFCIMKPGVVIVLCIFLMSCCLPATSTPNFNLASRQKLKHRHHELHKHFVSSSSRSSSQRHHKKRHAISRREAEVISSSNNDQSQNICSTDKQREIWQSIVYCQPNPTLVELQKPPSAEVSNNDNIVHMMPGNNSCLSI